MESPERRQREVSFVGSGGARLAAIVDEPEAAPRGFAVLAHCFTCTKDYLAPARIGRGLSERGIAVLRFDFTGLGASCGEFEETSFSTNVEDVIAAARYCRESLGPPRLLVGHSLGGAAVLAASPEIEEARAVVTIAAPSRPGRLARLVEPVAEQIRATGSAEVLVGGRPFRIGRAFVEDLGRHRLEDLAGRLAAALLVLHSPVDEVVAMEDAAEIFAAAPQPKSLVALDGVDHLVRRREDAAWVTALIDAWASRYVAP